MRVGAKLSATLVVMMVSKRDQANERFNGLCVCVGKI